MDVSILIVTYNSERQIVRCLQSVMEQRDHVAQQVIVLDNASSDRTAHVVRSEFAEVMLLEPGRNLGFAAGVNEAARHASGEFLLLLNPDTEIKNNAVDVIVNFAKANAQYGLYGGRTLKPDGSLEPSSCWGLPSLWSLTMFATGLSTIAKRNRFLDPESLGDWKRDTVREVGVITGCFLLVSRNVWDELSGFDERFFMYGEDTDFAMRARSLGYRPVICPEATVVHDIGQSSATPLHKARLLYRGKSSYIKRHWRGVRRWLALLLLLLGVGFRASGDFLRFVLGKSTRGSCWMALWKERGDWVRGYPESSGIASLMTSAEETAAGRERRQKA